MKIVDYIDYFISISNAISKGLKVVADHWPISNPFAVGSTKAEDGVEK